MLSWDEEIKPWKAVVKAVHGLDSPFCVVQMTRDPQTKGVTRHQSYFGTFEEQRQRLNSPSPGPQEVYMLVARMHSEMARVSNVIDSRVIAADFDHGLPPLCQPGQPLTPSIVIETSPNRFHVLWILDRYIDPDWMAMLAKAIAVRLGGDIAVATANQKVRLPGGINEKYGLPVVLRKDLSCGSSSYDPDWLWDACDGRLYVAQVNKDNPRVNHLQPARPADSAALQRHVQSAVDHLGQKGFADHYDSWFKVMVNLAAPGHDGYSAALAFSQRSSKFSPAEFDRKWKHLQSMGTGSLRALLAIAQSSGWRNPGLSDTEQVEPPHPRTDREFGRLIAQELNGSVAALEAGEANQQSAPATFYEWRGNGYIKLDVREKRHVVELAARSMIKRRRQEGDEGWSQLEKKLGSNRSLEEVCDHVAESLIPMSAKRVVGPYPHLGVKNGVLNMLTRELVPREYLPVPTQTCSVAFDPEARADRFRLFLTEIFMGNDTLIRYVLRVIGYAMLGRPTEHAIFILLGQTAGNGKSTLLDVLLHLFGEHATTLKTEALMQKSHVTDGATPSLAKLVGKRFAFAAEPNERHKFDTSLLKQLAGERKMEVRDIYAKQKEMNIECTMMISANQMPHTPSDDEGMWRRLQVIPFERVFRGDTVEKGLAQKLADEGPGILNVLLEGLADYLAQGLNPPHKVTGAIEQRREEADAFAMFVKDCCDVVPGHVSRLKELWTRFEIWQGKNPRFGAKTKNELLQYMTVQFHRETRQNLPVIIGIKLSPS